MAEEVAVNPKLHKGGLRYTMPITPVVQPVVVDRSNCSCQQTETSGFEQKIKENPLLFVLGALAVGYFLAKK